jgi:hypothetical protein
VDRLHLWARFLTRRAGCIRTVIAPIVEIAEVESLAAEDLIPSLELAVTDALLRYAFKANPRLLEFVGDLHELRIPAKVSVHSGRR